MPDELANALERLAAGTAYPPQAFYFVLEGMEFAKTHVRHEIAPGADGVRHFDAEDVCWCLHDLAVLRLGESARAQLAAWGITRTDDFGEIVFRLVDAGLIRASERDRREAFHQVFHFSDEFQYGPHWEIEIAEEDASAASPREPLRTPPRFGLKTLMVAVTLFCLAAGWFGWRWRYAQFQKQLAADIRETGGNVYYEKSDSGPFGPDFHSDLSVVSLRNTTLDVKLAERIARVTALRNIQIYDSAVQTDAMAPLARLPQLESLQLLNCTLRDPEAFVPFAEHAIEYLAIDGVALSQEHLAQIGRIKALEQLSFAQTPITDEQLRGLGEMKQLVSVTLQATSVRGAGLAHLAGMDRLQYLNLSGSPVDDEGMAHLPRLAQLTLLDLSETQITDGAMNSLARLPALHDVCLRNTAITDAALAQLKKLPQLGYVHVDQTAVTKTAAAQFSGGDPNRQAINSLWLYEDQLRRLQELQQAGGETDP
jgi:uncharacterized repeat protein (TIGR04138 family)